MAIGKEGNVKWVDGLRGVASAMVVLTHLTRSFDLQMFDSCRGDGQPPRLIQWPYIRILFQGRIGVAIFAMVTGYVCALKPIRLCRQGNQEAAFKSMGKSALRRIPRLVLPTTIATILIWFVVQLGGSYVATHCDSWWIRETGPRVEEGGLGHAVKMLINNLISTWTHGGNYYDANQWTMLPLLQGSMLVYVFMLATGHIQPRYRMMAAFAMWLYYYLANDPQFGMQFFFGVFLSDLQNHPPANDFLVNHPRVSRILSVVLMLWGGFIMSYPEGHPDWIGWSRWQHHALEAILPNNPDFSRFGTGLGLQFFALGLHFSPKIRDVLSNRTFLWLGKQSFAVYLLHGPFLRTVLAMMVFGFETLPDTKNADGEVVHHLTPFPGYKHLYMVLLIWLPMNYALALAWTTYVDPWCNRMTERIVGFVLRSDNEKPTTAPGLLPA